jgi:hypothetical protein
MKREIDKLESLFIDLETYYYLLRGLYKERYLAPGSHNTINAKIQATQRSMDRTLQEIQVNIINDPDIDKSVKNMLYGITGEI